MIIFSLDTNFVIPRIIHNRNTEMVNLLDTMILLQNKELLNICLPRSTQAEIYATLRAGRYPIKIQGKKVYKPFPHHFIMKHVYAYKEIFEPDFLEGFKTTDFFTDKEGRYKNVLFENMKYILGMSIEQSKEYISNKGIIIEKCND